MADYTTASAVKTYLRIASAGDDALIGSLVTRASAIIDDSCGRWFTALTQTRKYDAVGNHITGRLLLLDADLLTVTSVTNGDGTTIGAGSYLLRPINWPPFFGIALKQSNGLRWNYLDDVEDAITISGTWGYSATPPEPIVHAAMRLAAWLYRQRDTGAELAQPFEATDKSGPRPPARLPRDVADLIGPYVRLRMSVANGN